MAAPKGVKEPGLDVRCGEGAPKINLTFWYRLTPVWGPSSDTYWLTQIFKVFSFHITKESMAFPCSSVGKECACNIGDLGSIPGSRRSPGEGIDYPFQCSLASLVIQMVHNLPALQETWIQSLGWEDPLEKGMATHSSILA